jgi:hypothetical protein
MRTEIEIVSEIVEIEIIAIGRSIRGLERLQKLYGTVGGEN